MNALADFRDGIRFLLQDDVDDPEHSDEAVDRASKQVVMMGMVPNYTVSGTTISPDLTAANDYLLLCAQAAYSFVRAEPEYTSHRTRPYTETIRKSVSMQNDLQDLIYRMENGSMFFAGWQSLYSWLVGVSGLSGRDVGMLLTKLSVDVPVGQVTLTAGGITAT